MFRSKKSGAFRQGDVILRRVDVFLSYRPEDAVKETSRRVVLAEGEVTGHAHVIESETDIDVYTLPDGRRWVVIPDGGAPLVHEEHDTIALPAGTYEVLRQREYSPRSVRYVQD